MIDCDVSHHTAIHSIRCLGLEHDLWASPPLRSCAPFSLIDLFASATMLCCEEMADMCVLTDLHHVYLRFPAEVCRGCACAWCVTLCAGMVRETGDATEKFLRSMAAGDEEAQRELHDAAAVALVNLSVPCASSEPACLVALAASLTHNAAQLNQQVDGLLQMLQSQAHDALGALGSDACAEQQAQLGGGDLGGDTVARVPSSTTSHTHAAQLGSLPAAGTSGSADADTAVGNSAADTLQQLKAALAATAQLQQLTHAVQQLIDGGTDPSSAVAAMLVQQGSDTAAQQLADGVRRSSRQDEFQEGLTGSNSPFTELLQQQMSGAVFGSAEAAAVAAAAAAARGSHTVQMSHTVHMACLPVPTAGVEAADMPCVAASLAAGQGSSTGQHAAVRGGAAFGSHTAGFTEVYARDSLAQPQRSSQFLRRLSLEVNPAGSRRNTSSGAGRTSVDMALQQQQQQQQ
jgi:hypothetical protein